MQIIFTREFIDHVVDKFLNGYPRENSKRDYEFQKGDTIIQDLLIRKMLGHDDLELYLVCEFWRAVSNAVESSYVVCNDEYRFYMWVDNFFNCTDLKLDINIIEDVKAKVKKHYTELQMEKISKNKPMCFILEKECNT